MNAAVFFKPARPPMDCPTKPTKDSVNRTIQSTNVDRPKTNLRILPPRPNDSPRGSRPLPEGNSPANRSSESIAWRHAVVEVRTKCKRWVEARAGRQRRTRERGWVLSTGDQGHRAGTERRSFPKAFQTLRAKCSSNAKLVKGDGFDSPKRRAMLTLMAVGAVILGTGPVDAAMMEVSRSIIDDHHRGRRDDDRSRPAHRSLLHRGDDDFGHPGLVQ